MTTELIERTIEFRKRWYRWLGQVTRIDRGGWAKLLDVNWRCWVDNVLDSHCVDISMGLIAGREETKKYYKKAIEFATLMELEQLDEIYCTEKIWF